MTAVLFCMAMIIEIVYVFMSPVPKELENKYLLIGTAFICAADFTYHIDFTDLFFTLYMALFQPLLTMVLTSSYELMIVVIIAVVGLGMSIFMVHKEKNNQQEREK